jgi:hypothetical protein
MRQVLTSDSICDRLRGWRFSEGVGVGGGGPDDRLARSDSGRLQADVRPDVANE